MKTNELSGKALHWAVAVCEGWEVGTTSDDRGKWLFIFKDARNMALNHYQPSTNWALGGAIIEREKIGLWAYTLDEEGNENPGWYAETFQGAVATGTTPLIAAMRCYVASKLGDTVQLPEEIK